MSVSRVSDLRTISKTASLVVAAQHLKVVRDDVKLSKWETQSRMRTLRATVYKKRSCTVVVVWRGLHGSSSCLYVPGIGAFVCVCECACKNNNITIKLAGKRRRVISCAVERVRNVRFPIGISSIEKSGDAQLGVAVHCCASPHGQTERGSCVTTAQGKAHTHTAGLGPFGLVSTGQTGLPAYPVTSGFFHSTNHEKRKKRREQRNHPAAVQCLQVNKSFYR